jgi:hypothetical protein
MTVNITCLLGYVIVYSGAIYLGPVQVGFVVDYVALGDVSLLMHIYFTLSQHNFAYTYLPITDAV